MISLSDDNWVAFVIEAFTTMSTYLDDILNTDNPYFEGIVNQMYPPGQHLNKANASYSEALFDYTSIYF